MEFGSTKDYIKVGETFRYFEIMSNELNTPLILACPSDKQRIAARSFVPTISNANVSYFVGLDAMDANPQMFLAGDRNILGGRLVGKNILEFTSTNGVGWGRDLHNGQGNIGLADGSVQGFSSTPLRTALFNTGVGTNRFAMPD